MTSSRTTQGTLHQMVFTSPEGREEALWVEEIKPGVYRVLSVPVWAYGISRGSVVAAQPEGGEPLRFQSLIAPSVGGTVRFIVPPGVVASDVYLLRVIPDARRLNLRIGPATFFNPRLVSVYVHDRAKWWPDLGQYLDALVRDGILEQWEVGDPDEYPDTGEEPTVASQGGVLIHPLPVDHVEGQHAN